MEGMSGQYREVMQAMMKVVELAEEPLNADQVETLIDEFSNYLYVLRATKEIAE